MIHHHNGPQKAILVIAVLLMGIYVSVSILSRYGPNTPGKGAPTLVSDEAGNVKIIYIGMDGLDPELVTAFIESGHLPNFKRLASQGSFKPLITSNPPQSPVAWTSMATGKNPGKHGIFDFIHLDNNYMPHLSILREKRDILSTLTGTAYVRPYEEKTFWELMAENGIPAVVIRWPLTFPAAAQGNYKSLAGLGVPDVNGLLGRYTFFYTDKTLDLQDKSGRYVQLEYGDTIDTHLEGGRSSSGTPLKVPLTLRLDGKSKKIELHVQDNGWVGSEGEWSPWLPLKFKFGFIKSLPAICKFHVISVVPELRLYVTSIQFDPTAPFFPISTPGSYSREIVEELGMYFPTLGMPEDTKALMEGALDDNSFLQQCYQTLEVQERILFKELNSLKRGLLAFVFDTPDRVQHMFWRDIKGCPETRENQPILQVYEYMDRVIGKLLPLIDASAILIISSDHGFANFAYAVHMNTFLFEKGYLTLKEGASVPERSGLLQAVDWSRTKAYAVGFNSIYLNLAGREKQGIVNSSEVPQLTAEIIKALKELRHAERGVFPVENVYKKEDIYHGKHLLNAPDLIVGLRPGYRFSWQTALGGIPEGEIFSQNEKKWNGDHCIDYTFVPGVVLSNKKIQKKDPRLTDIAATILKHAGLPLDGLDGEPLF